MVVGNVWGKGDVESSKGTKRKRPMLVQILLMTMRQWRKVRSCKETFAAERTNTSMLLKLYISVLAIDQS
jgi:hypothetical protein